MDLEHSKLSLITIVGALPALVGGIIWLANINAKADAIETKVDKLEKTIVDIAEIRKDIEYIRININNNNKRK